MTTIDSTTSVGYQFVHQYYHYFNTDTKKVHCFFKKDSTYIHGYENGLSHVATGQQEVNDLITSGNFQGCRVRITQYDTIPSINDSILVMVIGILFNLNSTTQKFSQSFVLAKEADRKYYIASTAFRFHDLSENGYVVYGTVPMNQMIQIPTEVPKEESRQEETPKPVETPAPQEPAKVVEPEPVQPTPQPVQPTPQPTPQPVQPTPAQQPAPQPVQPTPQPVQPVQQPAPQPTPQPVQQPAPQPVQQPAPQPTPQPEKNKPKQQPQSQPQQHSAPKETPNTWASKAATGGTSKWGSVVSQTKGVVESKDETKNTERESKVTKPRNQGPDYSAYIANFEPLSEDELKNQFSVFGEVKSVAKLQGPRPGAFVNFLTSDALEKAVAATTLDVNGKIIRIERKKSKSTNSSRQ